MALPPVQENENGFWQNLKEWLVGTPGRKISTFTPEQQMSQSQLLQQLGPLLQNIGMQPQNNFQDIANNEILKFNTQTIPSLAERFTAQGAGAQRSSDYMGMLGAAGAGLRSNLASMGAQYQQNQRGQQIELLRSLMSGGFSPSTQYQARQSGAPEQFLSSYLGTAGPASLANTLGGLFGKSQNQPAQSGQGFNYAQGSQTNDYISNLLRNQGMGMNPNSFFQNSGIMRG